MSNIGPLSESEKKMIKRFMGLNPRLEFEFQLKEISKKNPNPMCSDAKFFNPEELKKMFVFTDGERVLGQGKIGPGWECKQCEMKNAEQHKEDTNMNIKKSTQLESLIGNIANARIEITIGCQSEFTLYKAIMRLRSVVQDAVNSEVFSDEKESLMDLLGDIHNLQMRDITRAEFGKHLDDYLNHFSAKLKELKEEEEIEAFKNKLLENMDLLYEMHKRINQE